MIAVLVWLIPLGLSHLRGCVLALRDSFRVVLRELPDSLRLEDQRVLYLEVCVEFLGHEVGDATR